MKHFYFSTLLFVCFTSLKAQLMMSNHAPVAGEIHNRYQCDSTNINPGPAGANVVWNFAVATRSSVIHSYTADVSSFFQPATVSMESNRSYEDHYAKSSGSLVDYSTSFPIVPSYYINLNYNSGSGAIKAKYPMSLNTTASAATSGYINAIMINPQAGTFTGSSNTLADGTGTLVLPGITYTNVLRVVTTENINYQVNIPGTITIKNYDYYAVGVKQPVFSIATVTLTRPAATVRRTLVTRIIHVAPAAPNDVTPSDNKMVCESMSTTLTASGSGDMEWFADEFSTDAIATGSVLVTAPLPPGEYIYYVQASNFLSSERTAITVIVNECTSIPTISKDGIALMYPNPTNGIFSIELAKEITALKIYTVDGKLIRSMDGKKGINSVDLSNYPAGVYFVNLIDNNQVISIQKVIVQPTNR